MADYKSIYDDVTKRNSKGLTTKIASTNKIYDTNAKVIEDNYTSQIEESNNEYDEMQRENAVDRKVNEHYIAEEMANMGLTDSGLNRTQITANTLSYSNKKAEIDRQRQAMVDRFTIEMNAYLAENENSRTASIQSITDAHEQSNVAEATGIYNTQVEAETAAYKAALSAETARQKNYYSYLKDVAEDEKESSYIIKTNGANLSRDFKGSLADNGVTVRYNSDGTTTYTDTNSGKSSTFESSRNPYTGENNASGDSDTAKAYLEYEAFDNGYQPKGVVYNGKYYGYVSSSGITDIINGNRQNVHKTSDGSLWIWDGSKNKYLLYEE